MIKLKNTMSKILYQTISIKHSLYIRVKRSNSACSYRRQSAKKPKGGIADSMYYLSNGYNIFFHFFLTKIYQYNINYYLHKTASINGTLIVNGSVINIKSEKTFNTYKDLN